MTRPSPESGTSEVIGRDGEIEMLAALAGRVAAGRGAVVLVQGEPGIGKTSLLDAARVRCAAAGLHIRLGVATELRQTVPFAALRSWLDPDTPGADPIGALLDRDIRARDAGAGHEIVIAEAILDHIETWCATGPLALIMDDVHWADASSVSVLQRLCARIDERPLLLLLGARLQPQDSAFTALAAELLACRAPLIRLGGLSAGAAAELVSNIVGATPGPGLLREVAGASGNPRYITELVAALLREQAITVIADIGEAVAGQRPSTTLAQAISRRLDFLPRRTRHVLAAAAALGPVVDVTELAAVLDRPLLDVWGVVSDVMATGVLALVDSEVVFRHELLRQVLSDQLPATVRAGLLRTAGRVLQTTNAPIERIAHYLAVADYDLDDVGVDWLVAVADKLAFRAPEPAVRLLRRAMTDSDNPPPIHRYIEALLWSGRTAEAEAEVRIALSTRSECGEDIEMRWLLAQACRARGRIVDAVDIAETALSTMDLDVEAAGRFHGMCAVDNVFLERFDAAEQAGRVAIAMGESSGDPRAIGYGSSAVGAVRYTRGDLIEALELSTRIPIASTVGTGPDQFDPYALRALCLIELDRLTEAEGVLNQAIAHNRRGPAVSLSANLVAKARLYLLNGRWDDAVAECNAGAVPDGLGYSTVAGSLAALIGIHRGTFLPDVDSIRIADDLTGTTGYAHLHLWAKALTHEAHGHPDLALKLLVDTRERLADHSAAATLYYIFPDIARLAADLGDTDAARSVVVGADELVARQPTASRIGTALLCRGLAERNSDSLLAAVRAFRRSGRLLYQAQAHENAAVLLAAAGRDVDARRSLDTAIGIYSRLGASWDTARTVARVRPYDIRRGVRGRRNRPKSGWAALTDTECKVAALVAEGCTNSDIAAQMFLSRRTVQSHVSNILAKLGLRSRREVAASMPHT
ncbi:helix-turn-helix transcriptional regulator [Nocardia sp. CA-135398]|uniref:helix-turn-helix transcriptional regulator n=1 Tax=Nocardia sp. CA-135398 TaxID=3239977 RepID=UPI003D989634